MNICQKIYLLFLIFLFSTYQLYSQNVEKIDVQELYLRAAIYKANGDYNEAINTYNKILEYEANAQVAFNIANCFSQLGNFDEAQKYLELTLQLDSNHIEANRLYFLKYCSFDDSFNSDSCLYFVSRLIKIDTTNNDLYQNFYVNLKFLKDNDTNFAINYIENLLNNRISNEIIDLYKLFSLSITKSLDRYSKFIETVYNSNSNNLKLIAERANILIYQNKENDFDSFFSQKIQNQPRLNRIEIISSILSDYFPNLIDKYSYSRYVLKFHQIILEDANSFNNEQLEKIFKNYLAVDLIDKTNEIAFKLIENDRKDCIELLADYLDYLLQIGEDNKLFDLISKNRNFLFNEPIFFQTLNKFYYKNSDYTTLIQLHKSLMPFLSKETNLFFQTQNSDIIENLLAIANLYWLINILDSAAYYYELCLQIDSSNMTANNNYAYFLAINDKDISKACRLASAAINSEPNNPYYLDTYGYVLFKQKKYKEALQYFNKALEFMQSAEIYEHIGDVYFAENNISNALKYWKKALEIGESNDLIQRIKNKISNIE